VRFKIRTVKINLPGGPNRSRPLEGALTPVKSSGNRRG
jgi:hypothetical protein